MTTTIVALVLLVTGWAACDLYHLWLTRRARRAADHRHDQWLEDYLKRTQRKA